MYRSTVAPLTENSTRMPTSARDLDHFLFIPAAADKKHGGEKICANDVLNKAELRNFHSALQKYLLDHGVQANILTGITKTQGGNRTVRELKQENTKSHWHSREYDKTEEEGQKMEKFFKIIQKIESAFMFILLHGGLETIILFVFRERLYNKYKINNNKNNIGMSRKKDKVKGIVFGKKTGKLYYSPTDAEGHVVCLQDLAWVRQ